jgi:integrase
MDYLEAKLKLMQSHGLNVTCVAFIRLHFQSGARIGDLLRIKRQSITNDNIIVIKQSKGSNTLIINLSTDLEFWAQYKAGLHVDISCFSRSFFYKLYSRYGLMIVNGDNKNNSVTHSARKQKAQSIYEATNDITASAQALGHKSTKSTEYYLTESQKKDNYNRGVLGKVTTKLYNFKFRTTKKSNIIYM